MEIHYATIHYTWLCTLIARFKISILCAGTPSTSWSPNNVVKEVHCYTVTTHLQVLYRFLLHGGLRGSLHQDQQDRSHLQRRQTHLQATQLHLSKVSDHHLQWTRLSSGRPLLTSFLQSLRSSFAVDSSWFRFLIHHSNVSDRHLQSLR